MLALRALALLAVAGLAGAAWSRRRSETPGLRRPPAEIVLALAWLFVVALSTALAPDPRRSLFGALPRLEGALALAADVALFLAARALAADAGRRRRLVVSLVLAGAASAAYSLAQVAGWDPLAWGRDWPGRPLGAQGNPVFLAASLLLTLPFAAAEVARRLALRQRRAALALALPALGIASALVAARGRGAWLGALAGAVVFVAATLAAQGRRALARRILAGTLVVALAVALLPLALGRPLPGFDPTSGTSRQRVLLWRAAVELLVSEPGRLTLGWGPESLALVLPRHLPEELPALVWQAGRTHDRAHNAVLDMAAALGLAGLLLAAMLAAVGVGRPLARCGLGRSPPLLAGDRFLDAACAAALTAHLVELQVGFRTAATGALAAVVLGLATARRSAEDPDQIAAERVPGALAGWLGGAALALLAGAFATAPRFEGDAARVLLAVAVAAALTLGAGLGRRAALGRALPAALLLIACGWGAAARARDALAVSEAQVAAALLPLLLGVATIAAAVSRREPKPERAGVASVLAVGALAVGLAAALVWGVARPLTAGVAFGLGRSELERGEPDLAAAAFAVSGRRASWLVDPVRLEARAAARLAAATRAPELRERRFAAALARLDRARARHPEDPDLDPESALLLARWSELAPDGEARATRLAEARARLEAAADRAPTSSSVQQSLAAVLLDLGEPARGLAAAERSATLAPRSLESALLVARARAAIGDLGGAVEALRRADELDGERARRLLEGLARGAPRSFEAQRDLALLALARYRSAEAVGAVERARALATPADAAELAALVELLRTHATDPSRVE